MNETIIRRKFIRVIPTKIESEVMVSHINNVISIYGIDYAQDIYAKYDDINHEVFLYVNLQSAINNWSDDKILKWLQSLFRKNYK